MYILLKLDYARFSVSNLFFSNVIEEKPLGRPLVKEGLRNPRRLLMSRNAISANSDHYLFKIFRGSMPPDSQEGLKNFFLTVTWFQKVLGSTSPQSKKS